MIRTKIRPDILYAWHGPSLLVTDHQGDAGGHPLSGLYFREARYLSRLELQIDGERPWLCSAGGTEQEEIHFVLVYPEMLGGGGGGSGASGEHVLHNARGIPRRAFDLRLRHRVAYDGLRTEVVVTNRAAKEIAIQIGWRFATDYADLQEAHADSSTQAGQVEIAWQGDEERAADGAVVVRSLHPELPYQTRIETSGPPGCLWQLDDDRLVAPLVLGTQQEAVVQIAVRPVDFVAMPDAEGLARREDLLARWHESLTRVETLGGFGLGAMIDQAMDDLGSFALLEGEADEWLAPAAGMPLYPALFGRDAITAGWQATCLDQGQILRAALNRLVRTQATTVDPSRDAEPGRTVQQIRTGPLVRAGLQPFDRYYGDFAGPLMLPIALGQLWAWTGDERAVRSHWDSARKILDWARHYGDRDDDGYLEYLTLAPEGPKNLGWKDSGNAIVDEEGRQVAPPIGTCEIQGYWFGALQMMAALAMALGAPTDAKAYWQEAQDLKERFNRDWWLEDDGFLALAKDGRGRFVRAIASNAGHCLAAGIVDDRHIPRLVERLFEPDLYSGWGIRTLSSEHPSYNPLSYHLGSVWTVENATIAFGLRRFGFYEESFRLFRSVGELARLFDHFRVPECIGGYARDEFPHPGAYPQANVPQAWNQSAFPLLVQSLLGLQPLAPFDTLLVDPKLPEWLPEVTLENLRVGGATVSLRVWRDDGSEDVDLEILEREGTLRIVAQAPPESLTTSLWDRGKALVEYALFGD